MRLAWGARVSPEFRRLALEIAALAGGSANDLMACIAFETGRAFSPSVRNAQSGATGLIQFMPKTAVGLGTTVDALAQMTAEEQMDRYVRAYFAQYAGRCSTLEDMYMAIFWPRAIGQPNDTALVSDADGAAYAQNKGLDLNADGTITKDEAAAHVRRLLAEGLEPGNYSEEETTMDQSAAAATAMNVGGSLLSMLNPVAGMLFNAFAPRVQARIATAVDRASGTPGAGQAIATALSDVILQQVKQLTGRQDDLEAVAVARRSPDIVAKVEQAAEATLEQKLKEYAPILDKMAQWDQARWQAEREGRDAAADRAIKEHAAGLWDMTRALVYAAAFLIIVIASALLGALIVQATTGQRTLDPGLLGLAGPILMAAIGAFGAIIAYRFDGSRQQSEQARMLSRAIERDITKGDGK